MTVEGLSKKRIEFILRISPFAAKLLRRTDTTENKSKHGFTLVESLITTVALVIITLGALSYQYHAARHSRIAKAQITAARTAQLLLEDWKSTGGSLNYDPSILKLGFTGPLQIPSLWSEGQGVGVGSPLNNGVYTITVDGLPMTAILNWRDVDTDVEAEVTLRELTVTVGFGEPGQEGLVGGSLTSVLVNLPPIVMATYVRVDATSG